MVKNTSGGKHKNQARKNIGATSSRRLRTSDHPDEKYAVVTKMMGGSICHVHCINDIVYSCIIRGKFKGKSKRNNILSAGTWVLIGLREWALKDAVSNKLPICDLLECYTASEQEQLSRIKGEDWNVLYGTDPETSRGIRRGPDDIFSNEIDDEFEKINENNNNTTVGDDIIGDDVVFDFDDI